MSTTTGAATIDRPGPRAARQTTVARHIQPGDIVRYEVDPCGFNLHGGVVEVTRVEVEYDPASPTFDSVWVWGNWAADDGVGAYTNGLGEFAAGERVRVLNAV